MFLGPAYTATNTGGVGWGWNESWTTALLPNLEQNPLFNSFNFHADGLSVLNTTVGYSAISSLICPSESTRVRPDSPWAPLTYRGNHGGPGVIQNWTGLVVELGTTNPGSWWGADPNMGVFGLEGVTDGSSNTALFSEKLMGIPPGVVNTLTSNGIYGIRGLFTVTYAGADNTQNPAIALQGLQACQAIPSGSVDNGQVSMNGAFWHAGYPWAILVNGYTHFNTPNGMSCISPSDTGGTGSNLWGGTSGMITPTSFHPGGVNCGFADGSVKFLKNSINPQSWWAIGTRNQGEVVSSDSY
jgi:prepilin-type processing-associated H-X9-DG protein